MTITVAVAYGKAPTWKNEYDDAYITFRYAVNLSLGRGLVFNIGERTDAASSLLYTLVLAFFHKLGATDLELVAALLGIVCAGITTVAVYSAGIVSGRAYLVAALLALGTGLHGFVSGWATSGMETTFYSALIAVFVARFYFHRLDGWLTASMLCAVGLSRVEGMAFVGGALLSNLLRATLQPGPTRKVVLRDAAFVVLVVGSSYLFKHAYYGTWLPHSYVMKSINSTYRSKPDQVINLWVKLALPILLLAANGIFTMRRDARVLGLAATIAVSIVAFLRGPMSDYARYSVPIFPVLAMLAACSLAELWASPGLRGLAIAMVGWFGFCSYGSFDDMKSFAAWYGPPQTCRRQLADWVNQNEDRSKVILSSDLGRLGYELIDFRFIDTFGLTSAAVLDEYVHGRNADAVLFARRPSLVVDTYFPPFQAMGMLLRSPGVSVPTSQFAAQAKLGPKLTECAASGYDFAVAELH